MSRLNKFLGKLIMRALGDDPMFLRSWGQPSSSGVAVNKDNVVSLASVYNALNLLSSTIATLPLNVYKRTGNGREQAREHRLYELLHDQPNELMTSAEFRRLMMVNYYIGGKARAVVLWDNAGQIDELVPIPFWRVNETIINGKRYHKVMMPDNKEKVFSDYQMFRIDNIGFSADNPISPLVAGKDVFGLSLAADQFGSRFFANGANFGGVLKHEKTLSEEAHNRLAKDFNEKYQGISRSHKWIVLEEGLDLVKTTFAPEEAQFLETRKFQVTEVARFFNVPPHLIMDLEKATFSNIEHQNINFVTYTLRPLFVYWEQEIRRSLLIGTDKQMYYAEYNADALLRGDSKTRAEVFNVMRMAGVINANEWREKENMNPIGEAGQIYFMPLNMADMSRVSEGTTQDYIENNALHALSSLMTRNKEISRYTTAQIRSASKRHAITKNYDAKISDDAKKVVKKETNDIRKIATETLESNNFSLFNEKIDGYYDKFPEYMEKQFSKSFTAMAKEIHAEVVKEINAKGEWNDKMTEFIKKYTNSFIIRHVGSSVGQIKSVVQKAAANGQSELDALKQRLDEWEERRHGKIGMNESVKLAGAVAKTTFAAGGVTRLMWVNMGSKSCPYCNELDGKIVGIEQQFVLDGVTADGATMDVNHKTGHPPLHEGCVCTIVSA